MKPLVKTILWLTAFSIAMGYLESAVVVYLRNLFYPQGFRFPLAPVTPRIAATEFFREAATLIMLLGAGALAGRTRIQRWAFFLYSFAVWDIFYYVFLKVLLGWPATLLDWDILFLIPVPWVGPVLAPVIVSLTMIAFAFARTKMEAEGRPLKLLTREIWMIAAGVLIIIVSFTYQYVTYVLSVKDRQLWSVSSSQDLFREVADYVPRSYNWWMFASGELILLAALAWYVRRSGSGLRIVKTAA